MELEPLLLVLDTAPAVRLLGRCESIGEGAAFDLVVGAFEARSDAVVESCMLEALRDGPRWSRRAVGESDVLETVRDAFGFASEAVPASAARDPPAGALVDGP